jgi:GntR family transcriptional regulator
MNRPAYEILADQLRRAILAGELTGRMPSLRALAEQHGVGTDIARRALELLRGEGYVVTKHGAGTFVRTFERILRSSPSRLSTAQWATGRAIQDADTGSRTRQVNVVVDETPAPAFVAEALGVEPDTPVLCRSRLFVVEERPVQTSVSYLPLDIAGPGSRLFYTDVGPGGSFARLAELGHAPVRFTERLTARAPRPGEVERLDLEFSVGAIVLEIIRCAYTAADRCVEVNRMILDATAYELEYAFTA